MTAENFLEVTDVQLDHNHELSEQRYRFYPKVRRLSAPEKEEAKKLLRLNVKPGDIKATICNSTRKQIQSKDMLNLASGRFLYSKVFLRFILLTIA